MGIKITKSTSELHPEGWHLFAVSSMEEVQGKHGRQIKWGMESKETREDGNRFVLVYWTGTVLSTHPECKLSRLLEKMGVDEDEFSEDTDCAIGQMFCGKVEWDNPNADEARYSNIVKVESKGFLKSKSGAKTKKASPENDPFEEE